MDHSVVIRWVLVLYALAYRLLTINPGPISPYIRKSFPTPVSCSVLSMFSSSSFSISGFQIEVCDQLELIFMRVIDMRLISFFCVWKSVFPSTFVEYSVFPQCLFLTSLSSIRWLWFHELMFGSSFCSICPHVCFRAIIILFLLL